MTTSPTQTARRERRVIVKPLWGLMIAVIFIAIGVAVNTYAAFIYNPERISKEASERIADLKHITEQLASVSEKNCEDLITTVVGFRPQNNAVDPSQNPFDPALIAGVDDPEMREILRRVANSSGTNMSQQQFDALEARNCKKEIQEALNGKR